VDYITSLRTPDSKENRIQSAKINDYIQSLARYGHDLSILHPKYIDHLYNEIWELRPRRVRLLFAFLEKKTIIILHYFMKKTQKTPKKEIERALLNLASYRERIEDHE